MRPLLIILLSGILTSATVAFAGEPPMPGNGVLSGPTPGSNLPDLGSPAETYLSKSDEFRLGAMVAK